MNAKKVGFFLGIVFLAGIAVFTSVHYYTLLDQNRILQRLVISYEKKLADLEESKKSMEEQLNHEKEALDLQLKDTLEQLRQVTEELNASKDKVSGLEKDNLALLESQKQLEAKANQIAKEKEALLAKLDSLDELKKLIHDLKTKMHQEKLAERRIKEEKELLNGNRGYLLFQGMPTVRGGKVRIEVTPVP
jgi:DNA repair exonuclease SbcCD ATPase subunit